MRPPVSPGTKFCTRVRSILQGFLYPFLLINPVFLSRGSDSLCNFYLGVTQRVLCLACHQANLLYRRIEILVVRRRCLRGAAFTIILLIVLTFDQQLPTLLSCLDRYRGKYRSGYGDKQCHRVNPYVTLCNTTLSQ